MEPPPAAGGAGAPGPGPGGSPAPFLIKTYDMVDDSATDDIVSWSAAATSFVVWNPPDFAARLLPTYFKHNNFSSFIRQLNTYGFRKIDPERWEFANEEFIKDQKHLLKNIHRRKPIHSHSIPPGSSGGLSDAERAAFDDEIDRLSREKTALQTELWRFKQQQSGTRIQLDDLERRMLDMEQRQLRMVAFLQRAMDNPKFVDCLVRMAGAGVEEFAAAAVQRKRRLQVELDYYPDNVLFDSGRPEIGQVFSDKLRLELCPAMSGNNLVSPSTQSSNEDARSPSTGPGLAILPESLELSDTGASKNSPFPQIPDDGLLACHLSLTLASCPMQVDRSHATNLLDSGEATEVRAVDTCIEHDHVVERNIGASSGTGNVPSSGTGNVQSLPESAKAGSQAPTAPPGRVNDVFWEQFLTERPGSSDAEEASSSLRAYPVEEHPEDRNRGSGNAWRNRKDLEQLTL